MDIDTAAELGRQALYVTILISLPAMLTGLVLGLIISLFQSITSIQDQTLSTVPKIVVTLAVTVLVFPWIMMQVLEYTRELYRTIPLRW